MKLLKSKRGDRSMIEFLIGLILVCMVIFFFSKMIYSCVGPQDMSSKTFPLLADKIESSVEKTAADLSIQKDLEPTYTYIQSDEILLFFDKGENYSVYIPGKSDLSLKDIFFNYTEKPASHYYSQLDSSARQWIERDEVVLALDNGISRGFMYAFKKPSSCESSSCMVLCAQKNLKGTLFSSRELIFSDYSVSLPKLYLLYCSNPKQLKAFDKINKFYRKPFYLHETVVNKKANPDSFNSVVSPGAFLSSKFFCPDKSPESGGKFPGESLVTVGKWEGGISFKCAEDKQNQLSVSEYKDSEWGDVSLLTGQYIYTQAFNDNVVLCYSPPCLSQTDELYINWGNHVDSCFSSPDKCTLLSSDIERYASNKKVVFKEDTGILNIKQGDYDFTYSMQGFQSTKTLGFEVELEKDDGSKEPYSVNELSLEYDEDAVVKKIRLDADGKQFSFIGVTSEQGLYPVLKFIVKPYTPK